ncbi:MAG: helix-turn-helix transcriptional regulator [Nocardioides sp.]
MSSDTAARKSERLMNLLIMLLVQRHYLPKDRIRELLYPDTGTEAFEKMFERDKEELRSLGVPIEVGSLDALFDEPGYRIRSEEFALPAITLTAEEAAVVGLAAKVWDHARLADATSDALRKLTAAGLAPDSSALDVAGPRLQADEPSFDAFWEATQQRIPVRFGYRRGEGRPSSTRHLQPWGVVRSSGRWYAVGRDTDRGAERVFRLSRVVGPVRYDGSPGSYAVPADADIRAIADRLASSPEPAEITLLVRPGSGHGLRRDAVSVVEAVAGPDGTREWDRIVIHRRGEVAGEVLSYGPAVVAQSPTWLRDEVVDRLTALARVEIEAENEIEATAVTSGER